MPKPICVCACGGQMILMLVLTLHNVWDRISHTRLASPWALENSPVSTSSHQRSTRIVYACYSIQLSMDSGSKLKSPHHGGKGVLIESTPWYLHWILLRSAFFPHFGVWEDSLFFRFPLLPNCSSLVMLCKGSLISHKNTGSEDLSPSIRICDHPYMLLYSTEAAQLKSTLNMSTHTYVYIYTYVC